MSKNSAIAVGCVWIGVIGCAIFAPDHTEFAVTGAVLVSILIVLFRD